MKLLFSAAFNLVLFIPFILEAQNAYTRMNESAFTNSQVGDSLGLDQLNRKFLLYDSEQILAKEEKVAGVYANYADTPVVDEVYNPNAFFTWGTMADLAADGLLQRGGNWSYERAETYGRAEMEMFIQIDTDSTTIIRIPGVLKRMLTLHEESSYKIKPGEFTELIIVEKVKFWKNGKFLVLEITE
ncbi:MAG: hypothetical protein AAGI07_10660 [Bacteroidota bacterium]